MKECEVPGLSGDLCRNMVHAENGKPYCYFLEAATLESSRSIAEIEPTIRENESLCPLIETVFESIEQKKLE